MKEDVYITKANGEREIFVPQKLRDSFRRAKASPEVAERVLQHVMSELKDGATTTDIYRHAFDLLKKEEKPAAVRYSLRKAIMDLGPTGFPFELLVAEIFRSRGFEVTTDATVTGKCVEHEVDIAAWNDGELIMCEAKFHNEIGLKSDLKVALYVNSRWEDLKDQDFDLKEFNPTLSRDAGLRGTRKLTEGWLVTNTKFSVSAIKYAKCRNMKLVGWNYPEEGGLQDLIEEARLHPITCLESITKHEEQMLMSSGIILCKQALENPDVAASAGLPQEKIKKMLEEIKLIQG